MLSNKAKEIEQLYLFPKELLGIIDSYIVKDKIFILGGNRDRYEDKHLCYEPETDKWTTISLN